MLEGQYDMQDEQEQAQSKLGRPLIINLLVILVLWKRVLRMQRCIILFMSGSTPKRVNV